MTQQEIQLLNLDNQEIKTLLLIEQAGLDGINTKQFRSYLYIQMPTTRVFYINKKFKKNNFPKKVMKRRQRDGTATYYLTNFNWLTSLEEKTPIEEWIKPILDASGKVISYLYL